MHTSPTLETQLARAAKPLWLRDFLDENAMAIRALGRRATADIFEIGGRLVEVKARLKHGGFLDWLSRELRWSPTTAKRFIQVFELVSKTPKLGDIDLPPSALYLLAQDSTPSDVVERVVECAESDERLSLKDIKSFLPQRSAKPRASAEPASLADQAFDLVMQMDPQQRREFAVRLRELIPMSAIAPERVTPAEPSHAPITDVNVQPVVTTISKATYTSPELEARKAALLADVDHRDIPRFLVRQA